MKQYKTLMMALFFFSILCFSRVNAMAHDYTLLGKTIYIDPGHPSKIKPSINRTSCSKL